MQKQLKKKENKFKKVLKAIGNFFNKPLPIIIALAILCIVLLVYIANSNTKNEILIGSYSDERVQINNIHYFANNDMNYFYAMNAHSEDNTKVYNYQVGYYTVDKNNTYTEFATRSGKLEKALTVSSIIGDYSGWNIAELAGNPMHFTSKNKQNMKSIHFVFKGSTKKDSVDPDIVIDVPLEITKLTK